ncbi:hypothetical protein LC593_10610 [Nostoc sp. CHAB 5844]|nr:hypothetical protein [Nostoc sp. CHAB 5844]
MSNPPKKGNGHSETNPEDLEVFEPAFEDEEKTQVDGYTIKDIREEYISYSKELPPELREDEE